jgi:hypothetical protein
VHNEGNLGVYENFLSLNCEKYAGYFTASIKRIAKEAVKREQLENEFSVR